MLCPSMLCDREHLIRTLAQFGNGLVLIDCVIRRFL
jgi:hypothetical protein